MRQIYESVLINIDPELYLLESYYSRVMPVYPEARFVRTLRFPVDGETIRKNGYTPNEISNKPFMPYQCVPEVKNYILYTIYQDKRESCSPMIIDLFERNGLLSDGGENFLDDEWYHVYHFLNKFVLRSCNPSEHKGIVRAIESIVSTVRDYTNKYPHNVFDINMEKTHIFIENLGEIGSYRYFEYLRRREDG